MDIKNIKGLIFDLDGVITDSEYYQWQGWVLPLKEYGIELDKETYIKKYCGKSGVHIDAELIKDYKLNISEGTLWEEKKKLLEIWFNEKPMPLMPYALEAIQFLSKKFNTNFALCSGGDRREIEAKLRLTNLLGYFPNITAGDEVKKSKPNPDIYLLSVERIGLKPGECIAIEDTQYGLQAAKDAGMYCIVIPNEYSTAQDFSRADKICSSLKEVMQLFSN